MSDNRPNVVLIMADQWRGDCLSCDGHPVVRTPYLDQFAAGGVRFSRAYTATPTCVPARAGLYTGMCHRNHGRIGYRDGIPWSYPNTIASAFTQAGYQTQAVGKMHVYPERHQCGFQNVILHGALGIIRRGKQELGDPGMVDDYNYWLKQQTGRMEADFFEHGVQGNSIIARPWDKPERLHYTNFVSTQSIDFLRRRDPTKPFFLFMSFNAPHPPYDPPAWAFEQYLHRDMPDPPMGDWVDLLEPYRDDHSAELWAGKVAPDRLQRARAGYYGHIAHVEQQMYRFIEVMRWYELYHNTIFLFVSDHGELLGDHMLFRKSQPYEGSARVPLIMWGPRDFGLQGGSVIDAPVELMDVMPTLLDAAGVDIPDTVDGKSLLPFARGQDTPRLGENWRSHIHGEHIAFGQSMQYVTDGREKFIWWSKDGHEQLFDLVSDPQERHDLARTGADGDRVAKWRGVLIDELRDREEGFVQDGNLGTGRPVQPCLRHLREAVGWE